MANHRTFLVTGCSAGGVGAALAAALARHGDSHVFATARSPTKIPATLKDLPNVTVLPLDVTDGESVRRCADDVAQAVEKLGSRGLDVLINNAGAGLTMPLLDTDIDKAKRLHDVNLWGALRMVQAFANLLIAAKGKIVNVSSVGSITNLAWNGE
jgi:NAD(P)-dependent dehydrogenase (short-subunit alcohol dehydrogenase family)